MTKKFLRRNWNRFSKLGKGRNKKQKWRKPKGRDNKMREKRGGYPKVVKIGYKKPGIKKDKIYVYNTEDLRKINENSVVVLGKIGRKKKIEMARKADEMGIKISNINIKKFLEKATKKNEPKK